MITKRQRLEAKIKANNNKIKELQNKNAEIRKETFLLCDKVQRFEEKTEIIGHGKSKRVALLGRIYWKEDFIDDDSKKTITIERSQVVRANGDWLVGYK